MIRVSDDEFEDMVQAAVAEIPPRFKAHLENVAFLTADRPTRQQLRAGGALHGSRDGQGRTVMLLGLYEGIPLPRRDGGYSGVLPDVITIFKQPHEVMAVDVASMRRAVHETVWHEVAHYFGLDHGQIRALSR
jgi:predicted Zn-dependent protease with MMP-like domain